MANEIVKWVKETMKSAPLLVFNIGSLNKTEVKKLMDGLQEYHVEINEDKDITVKRA